MRLVVEPGAYVEYLPEPLIPFAGARFEQELVAETADDASLLATELVWPGRAARGELFRYDRVSLRTTVLDDRGQERCRDELLLEPDRQPPGRRALFGRLSYCATALVISPGGPTQALAEQLDASVRDLPAVLAAGGRLPHDAGAFVRVLAPSPTHARHALTAAWRAGRAALLGAPLPPIRK